MAETENKHTIEADKSLAQDEAGPSDNVDVRRSSRRDFLRAASSVPTSGLGSTFHAEELTQNGDFSEKEASESQSTKENGLTWYYKDLIERARQGNRLSPGDERLMAILELDARAIIELPFERESFLQDDTLKALDDKNIDFLIKRKDRLDYAARERSLEAYSLAHGEKKFSDASTFEGMSIYHVLDEYENLIWDLKRLGIENKRDQDEILALVAARAKTSKPNLSENLPPKPLYKDRNADPDRPELAGTNVVDWIRAVWGEEMEAGTLTRQRLRELDRSADRAVENWLRQRPLPADVHLPTKREINDAALDRATPEEVDANGSLARALKYRRTQAKRTPAA